MQTFTSAYGRKGIRVADATPTRAIRYHIGRISVGTDVKEVVAEVRDEIAKRIAAGDPGWTPKLIRDSIRYTEWQHLENRAEYLYVMNGGRGWDR